MGRKEGIYKKQNAEIIKILNDCANEKGFSQPADKLNHSGEIVGRKKSGLTYEDLAEFCRIGSIDTFKYQVNNANKDVFSDDVLDKMRDYVSEYDKYSMLTDCIERVMGHKAVSKKNNSILKATEKYQQSLDKLNKEYQEELDEIQRTYQTRSQTITKLQFLGFSPNVAYITSVKELGDLLFNRPKKLSVCITQDCYKEAVILIENWYCLDRNTANFGDTLHIELHIVNFQIPFTVVAGIANDGSLVGIMYDDGQECYVPLSETGLWLMQNSIDKIQEQIPIYQLFKYPVTRAVYKIFCEFDDISPALARLLAEYALNNEVKAQEKISYDFNALLNCIENYNLQSEFELVEEYTKLKFESSVRGVTNLCHKHT